MGRADVKATGFSVALTFVFIGGLIQVKFRYRFVGCFFNLWSITLNLILCGHHLAVLYVLSWARLLVSTLR